MDAGDAVRTCPLWVRSHRGLRWLQLAGPCRFEGLQLGRVAHQLAPNVTQA